MGAQSTHYLCHIHIHHRSGRGVSLQLCLQHAHTSCPNAHLQHGHDVALDVTVVGGGGMMGMRIGAELALRGHNVCLYDRSEVSE